MPFAAGVGERLHQAAGEGLALARSEEFAQRVGAVGGGEAQGVGPWRVAVELDAGEMGGKTRATLPAPAVDLANIDRLGGDANIGAGALGAEGDAEDEPEQEDFET